MATTSKSPARVVREALIIARRTLPASAHRFSPKKFTQHQLFACLVLKEFLRTDYRGGEVLLRENVPLRDEFGLHAAPDYSTLQNASRRLLSGGRAQWLSDETLQRARRQRRLKRVRFAAVDCSGFESHRASHYFVRRRTREGKTTEKWHTMTYRRFPELALICDCRSHLILAATTRRGPSPDFDCWEGGVRSARRRVALKKLLADAGFRRRMDSPNGATCL